MHFPIDSRIVLFADYKGTENFQICKVDDGFHSSQNQVVLSTKAHFPPGILQIEHNLEKKMISIYHIYCQ
jgi:hypothetical protein